MDGQVFAVGRSWARIGVDLDRRTLTVRSQLQRDGKELYEDTTKNRRARTSRLGSPGVS
ncbi:hypothetical protein [Streptomyces sp. 5-6(2022)]|uniref:hypothetical protein n=1 Tax=Streptomyces sp. 5-6(2022) TaxID=2936510 RepID=UPI0023B8EE31|nr:hypothetical protein [Streptomyces sp. 5-6(2022)]